MDPMNVPAKFEFRSFIMGVLKKFRQSLDTSTRPFLPNF